ncbi:unnamed protein product [Orchesella dallaii]|uniref:Odorant receptor n=1 Tax=Orchesella dallaii TaxID=48710 RepID=A0ABP1RUQ8_9HEXA
MLLKENLIRFIKLHLQLQSLLGTRPFKFSATDKLIPCHKREYSWVLIKGFLLTLYNITEWMQVIHSVGHAVLANVSESLLFASTKAAYCFTKYTLITRQRSLIELFNLLLNFEKANFAGLHILKSNSKTLVQVTQLLAIIFATYSTLCYLVMLWIFPCELVPIAYFTMPECLNPSYHGDWSISSRFQLVMICIFVMWQCIDFAGDLTLFVVHLTLVQSYCFYRYVQLVDQLIVEKPKQALKHLPLYRQIQILNRYYNVIRNNGIIIAHEYLLIIAFIISVFMLISLGSNGTLPELILFGLCGFDGAIVLLVCNTLMGQIYSGSKQFRTKIKEHILSNQVLNKQRKWTQRYLKSCAVLKCNIGDVNFIEELTPLVMIDFCINQIVSLLLLQK